MNCTDFIQSIDDLMDNTLPPEARMAMQTHSVQCPACQQQLDQARQFQQTLRSLPTPSPNPEFFQKAIQQAAHVHQRRTLLRRTGFGSAIAAGLLLFALNLPLLQPDALNPETGIPMVTIALHETHDVRLVFHAEQALQNTRFTLQLPPEVELRGFPEQSQVSWVGSLNQGQNLLVLPVIAQSNNGGTLTARIENAGKSEQFSVHLKVEHDKQAIRPGNHNKQAILS